MDTSHTPGKPHHLIPIDDAPPTATLTVYEGAQRAELKWHAPPGGWVRRGGGKRGSVHGTYCRRHRANMEKTLGTIPLHVPAVFLTLTFPPNFEKHPRLGFPTRDADYKSDLLRFFDRIKYRHPEAALVWRLEFQAGRGAPHYHALLYGLPDDGALEWLNEKWLGAIGMKKNASAHAAEALRLTSPLEVCTRQGYISKIDRRQLTSPHVAHSGRWWGVLGGKHLPKGRKIQIGMHAREAYKVDRVMRQKGSKTSRRKMELPRFRGQ